MCDRKAETLAQDPQTMARRTWRDEFLAGWRDAQWPLRSTLYLMPLWFSIGVLRTAMDHPEMPQWAIAAGCLGVAAYVVWAIRNWRQVWAWLKKSV